MTTDEIVTELREACNAVTDGYIDPEEAEQAIALFDVLDTRLMAGEPLPRAWRR